MGQLIFGSEGWPFESGFAFPLGEPELSLLGQHDLSHSLPVVIESV